MTPILHMSVPKPIWSKFTTSGATNSGVPNRTCNFFFGSYSLARPKSMILILFPSLVRHSIFSGCKQNTLLQRRKLRNSSSFRLKYTLESWNPNFVKNSSATIDLNYMNRSCLRCIWMRVCYQALGQRCKAALPKTISESYQLLATFVVIFLFTISYNFLYLIGLYHT